MPALHRPQSICRFGIARRDITPPVGIYHRMWGAALHDRATGVHRPLLATAVCLEPLACPGRTVVIGLDHCLFEPTEFAAIRNRVSAAVGIGAEDIHIALSHTHGAGWMSRS